MSPVEAPDVVRSVATRVLTVALPQPVRNGTRTITEREYCVVQVRTEGGCVGVGVGFTRGLPLDALVTRAVAPHVLGRSVFEVQRVWTEVADRNAPYGGRGGALARAHSLVDIAMWDALAVTVGRPLGDVLGGGHRATVPVLAAAGYYRDGRGLDEVEAEYAALSAQGYCRFKMMCGGADPEVDRRRIVAARSALPPGSRLAVDVNGAWASADEALRFVDSLDEPLAFVEDPFAPDNRAALGQFRRHCSTPVAVGEWEAGRHRFRELLGDGLVDIVRPDATAVGGIGEWLRVAALAASFDCRILPHYFPELHLPLALASPNVDAVEAVPALTGADNFDQLLAPGSRPMGPLAVASTDVGLGIPWREGLLDDRLFT